MFVVAWAPRPCIFSFTFTAMISLRPAFVFPFSHVLGLLALFTFGASSLRAAPPAAAATPPEKPTIVFVHGAWGGGWQFKRIQPFLEARGYTVYRPTLTGLGERVHLATREVGLETHIEDIVNFVRFENLRDIILVGHSYGGMVITGVADRIPDRIGRLIYLDAMLPLDGESAATISGPGASKLTTLAKEGFVPAWWVKPDKPYPRDVPHPVKTLTDPIHLANPAAAKIPAVYVLTVDKGKAAKDDDFFAQSERARARGWPVLQMEGDHNPYWFQPEKTAEVIDRAAHEVFAPRKP